MPASFEATAAPTKSPTTAFVAGRSIRIRIRNRKNAHNRNGLSAVLATIAIVIAAAMLPSSLSLSLSLWKTASVGVGVRAFRPSVVLAPRGAQPSARCGGSSRIHGRIPSRLLASVTGPVYDDNNGIEDGNDKPVVVTLYTKEGCTLCDKVKDVLVQLRDEPGCGHSLRQVDITDADQQSSFDRYKYDIPVLHISCGDGNDNGNDNDNGQDDVYWTKHRLTEEEAREALAEAKTGSFEERKGRPNAAAMER